MGCLLAFLVALLLGGGAAFMGVSGSSGPAPAASQAPDTAAATSAVLGASAGLLDALGSVPDTATTRAWLVGYVDQREVERARPGAARPGSFAALETLLDARDPSAALWMAAAQGVASGSPDLVRNLFTSGEDWRRVVGFDFFDVDRQVAFGQPPADGIVLLGDFDPAAIGAAHEARGYAASPAGDRTMWCAQAGCAEGRRIDLSRREPPDPLGGTLGRQQPLAVSAADILSSPDLAVLESMLAAGDGSAPSLADDAAVRAAAGAVDGAATIIQATILPPAAVGVGPDIYRAVTGSPEEATRLLDELADVFEPIPAWDLAAIVDGATPTNRS